MEKLWNEIFDDGCVEEVSSEKSEVEKEIVLGNSLTVNEWTNEIEMQKMLESFLDSNVSVEDSESDDEGASAGANAASAKRSHVGSRSAITAAEKEIMDGVRQRRAQRYGHSSDATSPICCISNRIT